MSDVMASWESNVVISSRMEGGQHCINTEGWVGHLALYAECKHLRNAHL